MVGCRTRPAIAAAQRPQVQPFNHLHHKPRQMPLRQPLVDRWRQQKPGLSIHLAKVAHPPTAPWCPRQSAPPHYGLAFAKSDRLLGNAFVPLTIAPQPGFDHPLAQRFTTNCDPMILPQLLGRQNRTKIPYHWRMAVRTARRSALGLRRLLRRPRYFDIRPVGPAVRYAFNSRNTWRRSTPSSCPAAAVVNRRRSKSCSTSSRLSSRSLISRNVTPNTPRKFPGQCHLFYRGSPPQPAQALAGTQAVVR